MILDNKKILHYKNEIKRLTSKNAKIYSNGIFEINDVDEIDKNRILNILRSSDFIKQTNLGSQKYDFANFDFSKGNPMPKKLYVIRGLVKEEEDLKESDSNLNFNIKDYTKKESNFNMNIKSQGYSISNYGIIRSNPSTLCFKLEPINKTWLSSCNAIIEIKRDKKTDLLYITDINLNIIPKENLKISDDYIFNIEDNPETNSRKGIIDLLNQFSEYDQNLNLGNLSFKKIRISPLFANKINDMYTINFSLSLTKSNLWNSFQDLNYKYNIQNKDEFETFLNSVVKKLINCINSILNINNNKIYQDYLNNILGKLKNEKDKIEKTYRKIKLSEL